MRIVNVSRMSKSFNGQKVVNDISFDISKGEVFGLIGPNGSFSRFLSIFPLTSSTAMILRASVTDVPLYEYIISILLIAVSAYFIIEISVRIFRASLLMYGKKPTVKEVVKYVMHN